MNQKERKLVHQRQSSSSNSDIVYLGASAIRQCCAKFMYISDNYFFFLSFSFSFSKDLSFLTPFLEKNFDFFFPSSFVGLSESVSFSFNFGIGLGALCDGDGDADIDNMVIVDDGDGVDAADEERDNTGGELVSFIGLLI